MAVPSVRRSDDSSERAEWETRRKTRHFDPPDATSGVEPVDYAKSEPCADIPPDILKKIEANMKARGIMRRPCLKRGK